MIAVVINDIGKSQLHWSFSSKLPRDVMDSARMNSSNSIDPSCIAFVLAKKGEKLPVLPHFYNGVANWISTERYN